MNSPTPPSPAPAGEGQPASASYRPVEAVVFDWGGTLTPWHDVDLRAQWEAFAHGFGATACAHQELASSMLAAEDELWGRTRADRSSFSLDHLLARVGLEHGHERVRAGLAAYVDFWEPHTLTSPAVAPLWEALRADGLKVGVLSNTIWPREYHRGVFERDGVLDLIDADVYSSEVPWAKPDVRIFHEAADRLGVDSAACVYVGDRIWEDVHGAHGAGMRAILIPHSTIPADQLVDTDAEPDAVAHELGEILGFVAAWRADG